MKLLNLSRYILILSLLVNFTSQVNSEETIDIWKKNNNKENQNIPSIKENKISDKKNILIENSVPKNIEITQSTNTSNDERYMFGIFDPEIYDLDLNMWLKTDGDQIKRIFQRIEKIKLSRSAEDLFTNLILTYSYSPQKNISDDEFLSLKINWLINNNKDELLEKFLNKNNNFKNKKKVIQYLVDKNIAKANLKDGCEKSEFISKEIKDAYLEKFKIYCLIFNDKKNEAQLLLDILREENLSDKFFDKKINFLLGIESKANSKVKDDNLLNFYLSSITVPDFTYEPNNKTNKFIWEYLNSANLIKVDDVEDKNRIRELELAANNNTLNKSKIFEVYKKIPFDLNNLINAEGVYQSYNSIDSRALIYQKFLLSDNTENKIKLLFLLKNLFEKENLSNVYTEFMSDRLKELDRDKIPESYIQAVDGNIVSKIAIKLGKVKLDDKVLHRSRVIRYYLEESSPKQKAQKDLNNVYKKIKKNKKYFFSAKDLALIESLETDGFLIPKEIKHKERSKGYNIPEELEKLVKTEEIGLLVLKFVEIIGEDEISDLDPETIYFMVSILNQAKLLKIRNKVITTALPLRT